MACRPSLFKETNLHVMNTPKYVQLLAVEENQVVMPVSVLTQRVSTSKMRATCQDLVASSDVSVP